MIQAWRDQVGPGWVEALEPVADAFDDVAEFLADEARAGREVLPAPAAILRAFSTPLSDVRVLIVGQDPYPTPGDAVGLGFSVAAGHRLPPSLRNIAKELADDTGELLASGDLSAWQAQGVLLLNRVLTVAPGEAGSHHGHGWEQITARAIEALVERGGPLVAVLWGKPAQTLSPLLSGVPIVASAHPSPLSARRGFLGSRPFSRVNRLLEEQGSAPIEWATYEGLMLA
ncbi:uracil-DNA glycosylase [Demequina litorisediminis]|uniref:Uracil-DNA glycosylase n=1 Tax=Demequina litorisediminis TaxID=1849022 RepID=A0ABQ6IEG9_9MICO|nr:uracil-DNA glycosylase [Demequina litorisediminis]GMA35114.1 uracil-DNA glycosylase [Demequina litorisediminis]